MYSEKHLKQVLKLIRDNESITQGKRIQAGLCGSKRRKQSVIFYNYKKRIEDLLTYEIPDELLEDVFNVLMNYVATERVKALREGIFCKHEITVGVMETDANGEKHVRFVACNNAEMEN